MFNINKLHHNVKQTGVFCIFAFVCGFLFFLLSAPIHADEFRWKCGGTLNDELLESMGTYGTNVSGVAASCARGPCDDPYMRDSFIPDSLTPVKYIRLHFHILRSDDAEYPMSSEQEIIDIVAGMNTAFLPWRIQFSYDWRYANSSQYSYVQGWTEFAGIKELFAIDHVTHCNIYMTNFSADGNDYNWAVYIQDDLASTKQGGIILHPISFPDLIDFVPSHEMGHALGLYHTHAGASEVAPCSDCWESVNASNRDHVGDYCSDTEPAPVTFNCTLPTGTDQCTGLPWNSVLPENFMSYAMTCNHAFTPQQAGRMHCWVEDRNPSWITFASFDATNSFGPAPITSEYSGLSGYNDLSWSWDFGDGEIAQGQFVSHTYVNPGIYNVSVQAEVGEDIYYDEKEEYVWVHADTVAIDEVISESGTDVRVDIWMRNYVPIQILEIPISWDGPFGLTLDSTSAAGLRTDYLPVVGIKQIHTTLRKAIIVLNCLNEPDIQPDSGNVVSLYFSIPPFVIPGNNSISITPFGQTELSSITRRGTYQPTVKNGKIMICHDSDVNLSGDVELGDAVYIINYAFKNGPAPYTEYTGDANCDQFVNIGDAVFIINYIFKGGSAPCVNCL